MTTFLLICAGFAFIPLASRARRAQRIAARRRH